MKKIAKGFSTAALIGASYLFNPEYAGAQQTRPDSTQQVRQNRIYSNERDLSVAGDGVILKDWIYDLTLTLDTKLKLSEEFGLHAKKGPVHYEVVDAREGLENTLLYLAKRWVSGEFTDKATYEYVVGLVKNPEKNDRESLDVLSKALEDKIIDAREDSLFSNDRPKIKDGEYVVLAKSDSGEGYIGNTIPIILDIKSMQEEAAEARVQIPDTIKKKMAEQQKPTRSQPRPVLHRSEHQRRYFPTPRRQLEQTPTLEAPGTQPETETGKTNIGFAYNAGFFGSTNINGEQSEALSLRGGAGVRFKNLTIEPELEIYFPVNVRTNTNVTVTERESQLVGPNTYKKRTDHLQKKTRSENEAGLGLRVGLEAGRFHFDVDASAVRQHEKVRTSGWSDVKIERDGEVIGSGTIEGTLPEEENHTYTNEITFGAGVGLKLLDDLYTKLNFGWREGRKILGFGFEVNR